MKKSINYKITLGILLFSILAVGCKEETPPTPDPIQLRDSYQGGIVIYVDGTGQHGLVCANLDQSNYIPWCSGSPVLTNATNIAIGQGANNTNLIVSVQGAGAYAAKICDDLVLEGYDDWFLPTRNELYLMKDNIKNYGLGNFANTGYWCSTEFDATKAGVVNFLDGVYTEKNKTESWHVRAVRAF